MNDLATVVTADALGAMVLARSSNPSEVAGTLRNLTPAMLDSYSRVAGLLSTNYYMSERVLAGITTDYVPEVATLDIERSTDSAVGYTTSRLIAGTDYQTAATIFSGMIGKDILSVDRNTIIQNATTERVKYRRIASATACTFCLFAAVNSFSTFSEDQQRFHDHCNCTVVPDWDDVADDRPKYYDEFSDLQGEAQANIAKRREEIRPVWEAEWKARGGRMGKNLTRDFLKANPDLAFTQKNYLAEIRRIRST